MKKLLLFILPALLFISCISKNPEKKNINKHTSNPNLISFKLKYDVTKEELAKITSLRSSAFNTATDTIQYRENEIYISYVGGLVGCVEYAGDFEIKNDSLLLKLVHLNNEACTEIETARVTYRIKNPDNIQYKIGKKW